jgi:hypothetical protein
MWALFSCQAHMHAARALLTCVCLKNSTLLELLKLKRLSLHWRLWTPSWVVLNLCSEHICIL